MNLSEEKTSGDYIGAGECIGNIVPREDGHYKVLIYVDNQDIGMIREGQKVKYEVAAYASADYATMEGRVTSISKDIKVNQDTGYGYYEVEATIFHKKGEERKKEIKFIQGMAVQARLVTGQKSVMRYVLEKIDIWDN